MKRYDDDTYYTIRVTRPVNVGPIKYLPRDVSKAKGSMIKRIIAEHGEGAIEHVDP